MSDRLTSPDFQYRDGTLYAEGVPIETIAETVGAPFYCYSQSGFERNYREFASALTNLPFSICYALKANSNQAVIRSFAAQGAGADVVSEGELRRAISAGVPADRIVFSGVGKTREEMAYALQTGIMQFNIESEPELEALNEVAAGLGLPATVSLRINPDIDAATHDKISTGRKQDKFGIAYEKASLVYGRADALSHIRPVGIAVHIGSQLLDLAPYRAAFDKVAELVLGLRGQGFTVTRLDLGGGVGIPYKDEEPPTFTAYADVVRETVGALGCELVFEPGRSMVGTAGTLITTVLYIKQAGVRPIVVVDAAMNDLARPAMYSAYHGVVPVQEASDTAEEEVDIVGPVCESGDTFATRRSLPSVRSGDLLALLSAGAYGAVMSSTYNSRLLIPEVLVSSDQFAVVRDRRNYDELIRQDSVPDWLEATESARADSKAQRGAA